MRSVAAPSRGAAWAIGDYYSGHEGGRYGSFIEHWDGLRWSVTPGAVPPGVMLWDIAADSPSDVWAVGAGKNDNQALVAHWDGHRWRSTQLSVNARSSHLHGVAVLGPRDVWAVGDRTDDGLTGQTLVVHWDGTRWRVAPSPSPQPRPVTGYASVGLQSVAAVSADDVWAAGSSGNVAPAGASNTLIEHWDGKQWRQTPSPNPRTMAGIGYDLLFSIAADRRTGVWASGSWNSQGPGYGGGGDHGLVEHWDGHRWHITPAPSPGSRAILYAIAATPSGAWAVGNYGLPNHTLIEHWLHEHWTVVPSPSGSLSGITPNDAQGLWAVGRRGSDTLALACTSD